MYDPSVHSKYIVHAHYSIGPKYYKKNYYSAAGLHQGLSSEDLFPDLAKTKSWERFKLQLDSREKTM